MLELWNRLLFLMDKQEPLMTTTDVSQLKKEDAYSQTGA